jgi:N-acetylglucosamine-6-phosphate deacetylase
MERSAGVLFADNVVIRNVTVVNGAASLEEAGAAGAAGAPRDVVLRGGVFAEDEEAAPAGAREVDGTGCFLIPGLIDLQLNDMEHLDKTHRTHMSRAEHVARFHAIAENMLREGVTSFVLASLAMPWESLLEYLSALDAFRHTQYDEVFEGSAANSHCFDEQLIGAMVEGTFMNRDFRGCHNGEYVFDVKDDWQGKVSQIVETGSIFAINVAPETNPPACLQMIREIKERHGKIVAVGHCQPTGEQLRAAIASGVEYVIHLGNGHTGSSWKRFHKGGMLEECLRNDAIHVTLIADGFHLSKHYVRDWVQRKELSRVSFVSDRAFAMQCPVEFSVFGIHGRREDTEKGTFLRVFDAGDPSLAELLSPANTATVRLFGSHCTMLEIFENALRWFRDEMEGVAVRKHRGYGLPAALAIAVALCSSNPARLARKDRYLGRVAPGMVGNACLIRVDDKMKVSIVKVFLGRRKQ